MLEEVEAQCRSTVQTYLEQVRQKSTKTIKHVLFEEHRAVCNEEKQRLKYLSKKRRTQSHPVDDGLHGLEELLQNARRSREDEDLSTEVVMPYVSLVPKYDAWVPVRTSYWVGKDMEQEPYLPYFGDSIEDRDKASELYKDLQNDSQQNVLLSDGEVDDKGEIREPSNLAAWRKYDSLEQVRWRAACRHAICDIISTYDGDDENVQKAIGRALGIGCTRRIRALIATAVERAMRENENTKEKMARYYLRHETQEATQRSLNVSSIPEPDALMLNTHKHFCRACQVFYCRQHENNNVMRVYPIRDPSIENRMRLLNSSEAEPCSSECYLTPNDADVDDDGENEPWTATETAILRECTPVFRDDSCCLASCLGTRTCIQVRRKLREPTEMQLLLGSLQKWNTPRQVTSEEYEQRFQEVFHKDSENSGQADDENNSSERSTREDQKRLRKTLSKGTKEFIPCFHKGKCTFESCTCMQHELKCQSTCGCNNVRFCMDDDEKMSYFIDTRGRPKNRSGNTRCDNRMQGCRCITGHCNTNECECWESDYACDPDFCKECDCSFLPDSEELKDAERRCRNISVLHNSHKRTIVGESFIHGFGLFGGEDLQPGDLIGTYGGQLLDTHLADIVGRIYDAKDHTFFFDITDNIVIDGGVLGTKTKFINHTAKESGFENCHSKLVRVRGDPNIALFAKRHIAAGEELFFDYQFSNIVPEWARNNTKNAPGTTSVKQELQLEPSTQDESSEGSWRRTRPACKSNQ